MTASWEADLPPEFTRPAAVGLVVVLLTVIVLLAVSYRRAHKLLGLRGLKYVVDEDGANIVRRSTRSTKKPSRFEPITHGQGGTPIKDESSPAAEKPSPRSVRTPKVVSDAVQAVAENTPTLKRGPGRPKKTPPSAASPPTSPVRTRRGPRTPK